VRACVCVLFVLSGTTYIILEAISMCPGLWCKCTIQLRY